MIKLGLTEPTILLLTMPLSWIEMIVTSWIFAVALRSNHDAHMAFNDCGGKVGGSML